MLALGLPDLGLASFGVPRLGWSLLGNAGSLGGDLHGLGKAGLKRLGAGVIHGKGAGTVSVEVMKPPSDPALPSSCLLYTSDAADE